MGQLGAGLRSWAARNAHLLATTKVRPRVDDLLSALDAIERYGAGFPTTTQLSEALNKAKAGKLAAVPTPWGALRNAHRDAAENLRVRKDNSFAQMAVAVGAAAPGDRALRTALAPLRDQGFAVVREGDSYLAQLTAMVSTIETITRLWSTKPAPSPPPPPPQRMPGSPPPPKPTSPPPSAPKPPAKPPTPYLHAFFFKEGKPFGYYLVSPAYHSWYGGSELLLNWNDWPVEATVEIFDRSGWVKERQVMRVTIPAKQPVTIIEPVRPQPDGPVWFIGKVLSARWC